MTVTGVTDLAAMHPYSCYGYSGKDTCRPQRSVNPYLESEQAMAYVITDACQKDFLCASECSTSAIHPTSDESGADTVTQLFINPDECIDCGNCLSICPSNAIYPIDELPDDKAEFAEKNAAYFH